MSEVIKTEKATINFIGKAWINTVNNVNSKAHGKQYINITLDNTIKSANITSGENIQLWPNAKREGKQDADFNVSIVPKKPQAAPVGQPMQSIMGTPQQ